ncbi:hypothetical protein B9Y76_18825 [Stenotrophomonas maltophilia]|jgi:hypothetical protein|uniref:DUF4760 domain-containing protein n=1 Tax=Stenotrophomonas maltophilia TaxID=40324 RepID=UPI000C2582B2|nr:DUF4760 domain-containing protein [Stenotrophomonas maltophilia]ELC7363993.1 DUF4760 domain-containing protein [Stenotrophomonas maltophilia]PJK97102.1 hypothetical protein B9Y76_18825 [Stenotrophomonas maltophilia]
MLSFAAEVLNSPGFNSIVLLVGVFVALRQLRIAEDGIKSQLLAVKQQIDASKSGQDDSLRESRLIAKRKETARLLLESRGDEKLQRGCRTVDRYYNSSGVNIRDLVSMDYKPPRAVDEIDADYDKRCVETLSDRNDILYLLNHFENVAICVERDIYCRDMIVDAWRKIMIDGFRHSRALIDAMRTKSANPKIWEKFQQFTQELERESLG